jgi:hypothetical protein
VGKPVTDASRPCPLRGITTWILLDGRSLLQALEGELEALAYSCDEWGSSGRMVRTGSCPPVGISAAGLLGALSHLALVCGKCSQNLVLLTLGHLEEVKRSPKFSRDFVELGGSDL